MKQIFFSQIKTPQIVMHNYIDKKLRNLMYKLKHEIRTTERIVTDLENDLKLQLELIVSTYPTMTYSDARFNEQKARVISTLIKDNKRALSKLNESYTLIKTKNGHE